MESLTHLLQRAGAPRRTLFDLLPHLTLIDLRRHSIRDHRVSGGADALRATLLNHPHGIYDRLEASLGTILTHGLLEIGRVLDICIPLGSGSLLPKQLLVRTVSLHWLGFYNCAQLLHDSLADVCLQLRSHLIIHALPLKFHLLAHLASAVLQYGLSLIFESVPLDGTDMILDFQFF